MNQILSFSNMYKVETRVKSILQAQNIGVYTMNTQDTLQIPAN